jgi:Haem-binding uptake, Tiki superfamily, ChaN
LTRTTWKRTQTVTIMTSGSQFRWASALLVMIKLLILFNGSVPQSQPTTVIAQTEPPQVEPDKATKARLLNIVTGIIAAWDKADVVCLGEDHGSKNDSDLRITLIQHPAFVNKVNAVIVEFADSVHQDILDRLALEGEDVPRDELRSVWKDTSGRAVWESPIYEAFLRAVQKINLSLPRNKRLRLIAGDNSTERNRGRFIRDAVSREILDKHLKALAAFGSGHCENRGMGFPGELADRYPGRIWSASSFYNVDEGRRVFGLGDETKLISITGTEQAKLPGGKMFFLTSYNDPATLGDLFDAVIYYGNVQDMKVPATPTRARRVPSAFFGENLRLIY